MRIDEYNVVVSEEHDDSTEDGFQGNRGESMAMTSRLADLQIVALEIYDSKIKVDLTQFITDKGTIRHPISRWREDHESSDQLIAMYMAFDKMQVRTGNGNKIIRERLKANGYRTGNGDLISPSFYCLIKKWWTMLSLTMYAQYLIMTKLPYRWNEERFNQKKWPIEKSSESSADFMNFIHLLYYAKPWLKKRVDAKLLKEKVRHYFSKEPNVEWVLSLYDQFIDEVLR
jgi:hypothetical protein